MFISKIKLNEIQERIGRLERKNNCSQGQHSWVMQISYCGDPPYIRCSECFAIPKLKEAK